MGFTVIYSESKRRLVLMIVVLLAGAFGLSTVEAEPAQVRTPSPVIFLADNLGEKDGLGWCIDTIGRGLSDKLHAHSCKPRGGDVQFRYDQSSKQILSVPFTDKCLTALQSTAGSRFGLLQCDSGDSNQRFLSVEGSFQLEQDNNLCIAVDIEIDSAGPFQSRGLALSNCESTESVRQKWVIRD